MCGTFSHEDRPRVESAGLQAGPPQAETHGETDPRSAPYSESCLTPPLKDKTVDLAKSNISQKDSGLEGSAGYAAGRRGPQWLKVEIIGFGTRDGGSGLGTRTQLHHEGHEASRSSCPSWL